MHICIKDFVQVTANTENEIRLVQRHLIYLFIYLLKSTAKDKVVANMLFNTGVD